jgi:hypothetical protein
MQNNETPVEFQRKSMEIFPFLTTNVNTFSKGATDYIFILKKLKLV